MKTKTEQIVVGLGVRDGIAIAVQVARGQDPPL